MRLGLNKAERQLIREQIVNSTQPGYGRDVLLYRWLCGERAFPRRRDFLEALIRIPEKRTAGRRIIPFRLNKAQRHVEAVRMRFARQGVAFRGATLKARQFGLSTYWLASMMEDVTRNKNVRACLLADDEALAKTLLETGKVMRDQLPYRLPTKYENRAQLYFDDPINGWIDLATAKSKNPCRGRTYSFLHATEPGTWDDPEKKVASVNQAVPNQPGTVLSYEGTANGTGNWWHDFWWDAHNGNNDYHAFFFPWFYDWEFDYYIEPIEGDAEHIMGTLDDEEKYLVTAHNVNLGQLKWRRHHIRNNFFGDLDLFHQEFPATPEEAFLASGRPVFNGRHVAKLRGQIREPVWRGNILIGDVTEDGIQYTMQEDARGLLTIWHQPTDHGTYIGATDSAEGATSGDWAAVEIIEKQSLDQCAEFHGQVSPGELGDIAWCIGRHFNNAYMLPDTDGPGSATLQRLQERRYPAIGRRPVYGVVGKRTVPKFGWDTNRQTKYLMINECRKVLGLEDPPEINSETLLHEALEYEVKDDGTYGAPSGRHDDCLECYCVVLMAQKDVMLRGIPDTPPPPPKNATERHWREFNDEMEGWEDDDEEEI
tara:strand:+ start:187 stop:1977 length:1791 start_codon:yes stop_codon:yes gene_type:complete